MSVYFDEGYQAYMNGKQLHDNPYITRGCWYKKSQWVDGWETAKTDEARE